MLIASRSKPAWGPSVDPESVPGRPYGSFWPMTEGVGGIVGDAGPSKVDGAFTGSPTWQPGVSDYGGIGLGGWSTSNFVTADGAAIMGSAWPCFIFAGFSWTPGNSAIGYLVSQANSSTTAGQFGLAINAGSAGTVRFIIINNSSVTSSITSSGQGLNDGGFHTVVGLCTAANRQGVYADGNPVASGTANLAGITSTLFTIGTSRVNGVIANTTKGTIYFAGVGVGVGIDPMALHQNAWEAFGSPSARRMRTVGGAGVAKMPLAVFQGLMGGAI